MRPQGGSCDEVSGVDDWTRFCNTWLERGIWRARSRGMSVHDADIIAADAAGRIYELAAKKKVPPQEIIPVGYGVIDNVIREFIRRTSRYRNHLSSFAQSLPNGSTLSEPPSPDERLLRLEEHEIISAAMPKLPKEQRAVIQHILDGNTVAQTAEVLGISYQTANGRYQRGVATLKKAIHSQDR